MPKPVTPSQSLRATIESGRRYAEQTGTAKARSLLEKAHADLQRRLNKLPQRWQIEAATTDEEAFTLAQTRATIAQVEAVLKDLKAGMKTELVDMGKATAELRVGSLLKYLNQREKKFKGISTKLPINEAALLDRAVRGTESSILNRIASDPKQRGHKGVLDRYGDEVIGKFEEQLQIGLLTRKPWAEMRADLTEQSPFLKGAPAHWAERIVRTELMGASNMAGLEVVRGAQDELGDMVKILVATFDDRTGSDSYAVHGQIRRPNEAFDSWFGSYQHPPNRPNDREIVIPHRMSWPIESEFEPVSDSQVASRWATEGRKGSPPRRPKMSTVDRKLFGKG